jgi:hypothetical protein
VKQTESELLRVQGEIANNGNAKLQSVLEWNPAYQPCVKFLTFCGNEAELGGNEQEISANDL